MKKNFNVKYVTNFYMKLSYVINVAMHFAKNVPLIIKRKQKNTVEWINVLYVVQKILPSNDVKK